jgi:hypothetical protein
MVHLQGNYKPFAARLLVFSMVARDLRDDGIIRGLGG